MKQRSYKYKNQKFGETALLNIYYAIKKYSNSDPLPDKHNISENDSPQKEQRENGERTEFQDGFALKIKQNASKRQQKYGVIIKVKLNKFVDTSKSPFVFTSLIPITDIIEIKNIRIPVSTDFPSYKG